MRYVAILGIVCLGAASVIGGCSGGDPGDPGGAGGNGNASSSSSSGEGGMGTSTSSSSSGMGGGMASSSSSSSGGGMLVNGCDMATAKNETANAAVTIKFGVAGFTYDPPCIRVKKGTKVTFEGAFLSHPLVGGTTTAGMPPVPDPTSPIQPTKSGTSATFTMDTVGIFPYYCEYHIPNMAGVVYVE